MAQINKPNEYFDTLTWTGDNSTRNITDLNFQPDLVWLKHRSFAFDHREFDSVRGASKSLATNTTGAEASPTDELTAFLSNGFTLGNSVTVNGTGYGSNNFVGWSWKGGGTASSNTDGSITSSVSANTTSGFSVVGWTGTGATATVGHGLGTTPKLFIVKERSEARNWPVVTTAIDGSWDSLYLNLTDTAGSSPQSADSSVFNFTSSNEFNASGQTYISYCFANKAGFSRMGSYVGNGSADGTFVYTGFKPAFLMYKQSSASGESWIMQDNARNLFNVTNKRLLANAGNVEADEPIDFLSNGFKCRTSGAFQNASGSTYIYLAIAESPIVGSNSVPTTAR